MKNIFLIIGISLFFNGSLYAQSDDWSPKNHNLIKSVREDGRFSSSYGVVHAMLRNTEPRYAFHREFSPKEFRKWQKTSPCDGRNNEISSNKKLSSSCLYKKRTAGRVSIRKMGILSAS